MHILVSVNVDGTNTFIQVHSVVASSDWDCHFWKKAKQQEGEHMISQFSLTSGINS